MRLLCFVFFSIWSDWLCAQTPAYMHYDARNGLPGNLVYCGVQDRRGLLWFGTDKGLACFDGIRFRTYGLEDGLPDLEVLKMKEDSQGRLWLFCFRKEPCYFYNGRIYNRQQDSLLARMELSTNIINICEDSGGNLWFFEMSTNIFRLHERAVKTYQLPEWAVGLEKIGTEEYIVGVKNIMYGGKVTKFDYRTGQTQNVAPKPFRDPNYRMLRTAPILFAPTNPRKLYFGANTIWQTTDGGNSWTEISRPSGSGGTSAVRRLCKSTVGVSRSS